MCGALLPPMPSRFSPAAEPRLLGHRSGQLPPSAGGVVQHLGQSVQDFFAHVPDHHVRLLRLLLYRHQQTQQKSTGDINRWNSSRWTSPPVQGGFSSGCGGLIVGWVPLSVAHTAGSVTGCSSSRVSPFKFVWGAHTHAKVKLHVVFRTRQNNADHLHFRH